MSRLQFDFTAETPALKPMPAREEAWCRLRREKLASGEWRLRELEERYAVFCLGWDAKETFSTNGDCHVS